MAQKSSICGHGVDYEAGVNAASYSERVSSKCFQYLEHDQPSVLVGVENDSRNINLMALSSLGVNSNVKERQSFRLRYLQSHISASLLLSEKA